MSLSWPYNRVRLCLYNDADNMWSIPLCFICNVTNEYPGKQYLIIIKNLKAATCFGSKLNHP